MATRAEGPLVARGLAAAAVAVAAFALALALKRAFLPAYLAAEPWSGVLALALVAMAVEGARRALRVTPLPAWGVGAPLMGVLLVLVLSTPLPYEVAHHAERLPHPDGTVRPTAVETPLVFERRHPVATAIFRYAPDRDLRTLVDEAARAFAEAGWTVGPVRRPEGNAPDEYGIVTATRGRFDAMCVLGSRGGWVDWEGPMRTMGCRLAV